MEAQTYRIGPGAVAHTFEFLAYLVLDTEVGFFTASNAQQYLSQRGWTALFDDHSSDGLMHADVEEVLDADVHVWVLPTAPEGVSDPEPWNEALNALDLAALGS